MGARQLRDGQTVFTGVGAPMLATVLAQRRHAPRLTMVVEGGIVGPGVAAGLAADLDQRDARRAITPRCCPRITDVFLMAQRGFLDVGFIGGAQIDRHGNLNTSAIGGYERPKVRLPGSGGANDIISLCREVIILTAHEPRRFVDAVDFVTSPGYLAGGDSRRRSGLLFGGVSRVVTTLGALRLRAGQPAHAARGGASGRDGRRGARPHAVRAPGGRPRRRPPPRPRARTSSPSCARSIPTRQLLG